MTRADYTRTCAGCGSVVTEDWVNGQKCFRCYEPGQTCGYIVGIERFLPYVPAWCPKMGGPTTAGKIRGTKDMKKLYSKQLGSEVYALAPEQLKVFASSGYEVTTPEAVIADAGAIRIVPPVGKRAYAVFKFTTGAFVVRTSAETMTMQEVGTFVGEVVQAAIVCKLAENADPDRPKPEAAGGQIASAVAALTAAIRQATGEAHAGGDQAAAESPEVTE